jgi:hypothetical protein
MNIYRKCVIGVIVFSLLLSFAFIFRKTDSKNIEHFENEGNSLNQIIEMRDLMAKLSNQVGVVSNKVDIIETFLLKSELDELTEEEYDNYSKSSTTAEEYEFDSNASEIYEEEFEQEDDMNSYEYQNTSETIGEYTEEPIDRQTGGSTNVIEGFVDSVSLNCHHL